MIHVYFLRRKIEESCSFLAVLCICVQLYSQLVYIQHTQVSYSIIKSLVLQLKVNNRNKEQFNNPFPTTFYRDVRKKFTLLVLSLVIIRIILIITMIEQNESFAVKYSNMNYDLFMSLRGIFETEMHGLPLQRFFVFF